MEKLGRPRGTRDFLPEETAFRREVRQRLEECAMRFGYGEVMTPTFEHVELFLRKSGEEVVEQIYSFVDKGGRTLALRPELTASTIRLFSEGMRDRPLPQKLFYFENCFRYERPQKGRYREFWQFGAELVGPEGPEADAEIIHLAHSVLKGAGLSGFRFRVGHVGVLRSVIEWCGLREEPIAEAQAHSMEHRDDATGQDDATGYAGMKPGSRRGGEKDGASPDDDSDRAQDGDDGGRVGGVMSLIDKGDIAGLEALLERRGLPTDSPKAQLLLAVVEGKGPPGEVLGRLAGPLEAVPGAAEGLKRLSAVTALLDSFGVEDYQMDLAIARGLDYYTGVVFESDVESLGAEKQVVGGGRYELAHLFGLRPTPMTGFAVGFDRLCLALEKEGNVRPRADPCVHVIPLEEDGAGKALELVARLRNGGICAEGDLMGRNLKKALAHASDRGARYILLFGGDELRRGNVIIKDSRTREQKEVPLDAVVETLRKMTGAGAA